MTTVPLFYHSYADLGDAFGVHVEPGCASKPHMFYCNLDLAQQLAIDATWLQSQQGIDVFSGRVFPHSAKPIAMAYAGRQFGQLVPSLGDGRAMLLGEVLCKNMHSPYVDQLMDIHLKGSGQTLFSRAGDGKAPLSAIVREIILCEAMHALNIPTSRALTGVRTGDIIWRDKPIESAVLGRVAKGHVRIGSFEYFAIRNDSQAVAKLVDYALARWYPQQYHKDIPIDEKAQLLFAQVVSSQAQLVAKWMHCGFIHGVMNTDNITISGETIDYGPCAFMDIYRPTQVFSSIDAGGRYAYANQPTIMAWNICRFAESLLCVHTSRTDIQVQKFQDIADSFLAQYQYQWLIIARKKLGIGADIGHDIEDTQLAEDWLRILAHQKADFTLGWRALAHIVQTSFFRDCIDNITDIQDIPASDCVHALRHIDNMPHAFFHWHDCISWLKRWCTRLMLDRNNAHDLRLHTMRHTSPAVIARNHLVNQAITAVQQEQDFAPYQKLMAQLADPWSERPANSPFVQPPSPQQRVIQTFCGT